MDDAIRTYRDGQYEFARMEGGTVRIRRYAVDDPTTFYEHFFPWNIWCSVIATVSNRDEINGRFYVAEDFHNG